VASRLTTTKYNYRLKEVIVTKKCNSQPNKKESLKKQIVERHVYELLLSKLGRVALK